MDKPWSIKIKDNSKSLPYMVGNRRNQGQEFKNTFYNVCSTMSYVALRAAFLAWIVRPGYSSGEYILGCSQCLASWSVVCRPSSVIHYPSSVICDSLCVVCDPWSVICYPSCVICHPSPVVCLMSCVIRHLSFLVCEPSSVIQHFFVTDGGFQLSGTYDFSWHTIFRLYWGVPNDLLDV